MAESSSFEHNFPDLNYYDKNEPWRNRCLIAHEIILAAQNDRSSETNGRLADASWSDDEGYRYELTERQYGGDRPTHADYWLTIQDDFASTSKPIIDRYCFSSAASQLYYSEMPTGDLPAVTDDAAITRHNLDIIEALLSFQENPHHSSIYDKLTGTAEDGKDGKFYIESEFWKLAGRALLVSNNLPTPNILDLSKETLDTIRKRRDRDTQKPSIRSLADKSAKAKHERSPATIERIADRIVKGGVTLAPTLDYREGEGHVSIADQATVIKAIQRYLDHTDGIPSQPDLANEQ